MKSIFITATDTDAGKTYVTALLHQYALTLGLEPAVFKPIASGCNEAGNPLSNPDLATLHQLNPKIPLSALYEWCFDRAIAPHIAAKDHADSITIEKIARAYDRLTQERLSFADYDIGFIEGAGGWLLPLNEIETLDEWVVSAGIPVIFVVGMKLGCLNHALLTAKVMVDSGANVLGWIANSSKLMPAYAENLQTLIDMMPFQLLAEIQPSQAQIEETGKGKPLKSALC